MEITTNINEIKLVLENENKKYNLSINKLLNTLFIKIIEDENHKKEYSREFCLNDLIQCGKFFNFFEDIDTVISTLKEIFEYKKPIIQEQYNQIELTIIPILSFMGNVKLIIPKKYNGEEDQKDIKELKQITEAQANEIKLLQSKITTLEEKMKIFEETTIYKRISNSKDLIGVGDIIKTKEQYNLICDWISPYKILRFELLYKGSKELDISEVFHKKCDNQGPTISIIESTDGEIFGGYTSKSWNVNNTYEIDEKAFLFNLNNKAKFCSSGTGRIINNFGFICDFGEANSHELFICSNYHENGGFCENGKGFNFKNYELTGGKNEFKIKEIEVYKVIDPEAPKNPTQLVSPFYLE